jgi:hypothetical protein
MEMQAAKTVRSRLRLASRMVATALLATLAAPVAAHEGHVHETLSFDRPEAWALKYFTSATLLAGLEPPRASSPWSVSFGAEVGWLPPVSDAQRFVGFNGTKPEDLNKAPLFVRPQISVALPGRFSVTLAVNPPITTFGLTPRLFSLAVGRPVYTSERWSLGLRGYAQAGSVSGAYTCPARVVQFAPGSPDNLYGCQAESTDRATLRYLGGELSVSHRSLGGSKISPHAALAFTYMDVAFQVNALTFGFTDETHYDSHGVTVSGSAGISYPIGDRFETSVDAFYSPLGVERPVTGPQVNGFFNVRALLTYRLR